MIHAVKRRFHPSHSNKLAESSKVAGKPCKGLVSTAKVYCLLIVHCVKRCRQVEQQHFDVSSWSRGYPYAFSGQLFQCCAASYTPTGAVHRGNYHEHVQLADLRLPVQLRLRQKPDLRQTLGS